MKKIQVTESVAASAYTVGQLAVSIRTGHIGEITEIFSFIRGGSMQPLHHLHTIDHNTGLKRVCPDSRCHGEHTCPIHGTNEWANGLKPLPEHDLKYFVKEGMISKQYLKGKTK
jgi:hypothetical protein